jgi:hypothetical protein
MRKLVYFLMGALLLLGCARQAPRQAPPNPCEPYAKTAVSQNEENIRLGCGYSGIKWHSDYERHLQWCQTVSQSEADAAVEERARALKQCPKPQPLTYRRPKGKDARCDHYARTAISQNKENIRRACGYTGELWHSDYQAHYDYCRKVGPVKAQKRTAVRGKAIERCYPEDRCDTYARVAVWQNNENLRRGCGFKGGEWDANYDRHFQWCRKVPQKEAEAATAARNKALQQCPIPPGTPPKKTDRCETYAQEAVDQNKENVRRGCGFTGGSWHSDYDAHYRWCEGVTSEETDKASKERDDLLGKCGSQ